MMHTEQASDISIMGPQWLRTFEGVEPMGRGRAKAKQVKVARQLKYNSGGTDLDRLRAELGVGTDHRDGDEYDTDRDVYDDDDSDAGDDEETDDDDSDEDAWGRKPARLSGRPAPGKVRGGKHETRPPGS